MATNAFGFTPAQELARKQEDLTSKIHAIFIALIPLSIIAVILRFISRRLARARLWWDDWLTVVALVFAVGLNVDLLYGVAHGLGKHVEFAGIADVVYGAKVEIAAELIYQVSMTSIKLAILLFYHRLFSSSNPRFVIAVWVMATVTMCWYITSTFIIIFQCFPIHYMWDRVIPGKVPGGQCIPQEALWIGSSVTSLLTDAAILCLPMPMIWNMRASRNQKIALSGVFLLGAFVCITSIIRLSTIDQLSLSDPTYTDVSSAIWTSVECSVAVISASLPTMKPLFRSLLDLPVLPHEMRKISRDDSDTTTIAGSQSTSSEWAKHWRKEANAQRICDLAEFRRCDEEKGMPQQMPGRAWTGFETQSIGKKMSRGRLDSEIIAPDSPHLYGKDRPDRRWR